MSKTNISEEDMETAQFRLSRYATLISVEDTWVLASGVHLQRIVLDRSFTPFCGLLQRGAISQQDIVEVCPPGIDAARLLSFLRERYLLVPDGTDEDSHLRDMLFRRRSENMRRVLAKDASRWPPPVHYWNPHVLKASDFAMSDNNDSTPHQPLRVFLIGGCVLQFAEETIVKVGLERGFDVHIHHEWPPLSHRATANMRDWDPHLTVLQPTVHPLMAGLWDEGALISHAERRKRLESLKVALSSLVARLAEAVDGRLALVHNFAPPAVSPFGRIDFRLPVNFREIISELNHHVDETISQYNNLMVLDEERLSALHGSGALFDDLVLPFGHHGGALDCELNELNQLPLLSKVLAHEYLDAYQLHHGIDRVKCIVVDLDGTLWPGIAAEDGFGWLEGDGVDRWIRLGLHQALRVIRNRGILLAACSKGSEQATLATWRRARHPLLLTPDDFVSLQINWRPKSENIATLCRLLGQAPEHILVLDDNPVERAEIRRHLPGVRILELPLHDFRRYLLTTSSCEVSTLTDEARTRTETTRAMLARAELTEAAMDMNTFLRTLEIEIVVQRANISHAARVAELLNRTNQFTTTALRVNATEIYAHLSNPLTDVLVMSVTDTFADYGVVGVCVLKEDLVTALAVSCRVIGLDVALPFLVTCLVETGRDHEGVTGIIVETSHNYPARDIFARAGFDESKPGEWVLRSRDQLIRDGFPQRVTVHGDR